MKTKLPPLGGCRDQRLNQAHLSVAQSQQQRTPHPRRYWPPCLAALLLACSSPVGIDRAKGGGQDVTADASTDAEAGADAEDGADAEAGADVEAGIDAEAGTDAEAGIDDDAGMDAGAEIDVEAPVSWCTVQAVLALKCQRCHGSPATHGAPFPLVSYEDTQVIDRHGVAQFERIARVVEQGSMPALFIKLKPPVEPLLDDERMTILSWCAQGGGPTGSATCEPAQ